MNTAICTIITKSYLAYARAMAHQVQLHHPSAKMYVLITDACDNFINPESELFEVIQPHQLGGQLQVRNMSQYYSAFEYCNALRPLLHDYLLENTDHDAWIYLDSDIHIVSSLDEVFAQLSSCDILVSPHCWTQDVAADPVEHTFLKYGIYNSGFLGIRRSPVARKFIDWFRARLEFHCLEDSHCFVDQSWLNLVPLFFDNVTECKHPGTNVSFWNLHERKFEEIETGNYLVNGQPLLFLHFSGGDMESPDKVFHSDKKFRGEVHAGVKFYFQEYYALLMENGIEESSSWPYGYSHNPDGVKFTKSMRRTLRAQCMQGDEVKQSKPTISFLKKLKQRVFPMSQGKPHSLWGWLR